MLYQQYHNATCERIAVCKTNSLQKYQFWHCISCNPMSKDVRSSVIFFSQMECKCPGGLWYSRMIPRFHYIWCPVFWTSLTTLNYKRTMVSSLWVHEWLTLWIVCRSISVSECRGQPAALSQQSHTLLQLHSALPVCRGELRGHPGADHTCLAGTPHRQQTTSVGSSHHIHWTYQEPAVQVLASRVCALCSRDWKVRCRFR